MKIVANKGNRISIFRQGQLIRWQYLDENGLFDAKAKRYIGKFFDADELDYYMKALKNSSASIFKEPKLESKFEEENKETKELITNNETYKRRNK